MTRVRDSGLPGEIHRSHHSTRVRRRVFVLAGIGASFLGSVGFWLASSGVVSPSIAPPPGTPTSGALADVTTLSAVVTRTNGGAQLQTGVALAKIVLSSAMTTKLGIDIAWTNTAQAAQVLNNPNAQISIGLYHTIHTNNCIASSNNTDAPLVNLTDTDAKTYCAALDQGSTGRFVSSTGKLLLAQNQVGGFLLPSVNGSGALNACTSSGTDTNTWCQPASITDPNQRTLFVIASIVTPGGIPEGQQPSLASLGFYIGARAS